jgi:thioredoxin 1
MAHDQVLTVHDLDFDEQVLASPVPVLVDFTAAWCSPCRALEPIVDRIAREQQGAVRVARIDVDEAPATAARFGIRGMPTVVAFVGGRERARHVGLTRAEVLLRLLPERADPPKREGGDQRVASPR